jgi:hypothetical protein
MCKNDEGSACDPFVWATVREFAQYVVECREDEQRTGVSVPIELELPEDFKIVGGRNSQQIGRDLKNLINKERRVRMYLSVPFG